MKNLFDIGLTTLFVFIACILLGIGEGVLELVGMIIGVIAFCLAVVTIWFHLSKDKVDLAIVLIVIVEVLFMCWIIRPIFHGLAMEFFKNPWLLEILLISIFVFVVTYFVLIKGDYRIMVSGFFTIITFVVLLVGFSMFATGFAKCYIAETMDVNEIFELPVMDEDFVRVTPMKVSNRYVSDAIQYPRHRPYTPPDIVMLNNKPFWVNLLTPDGIINVFNIKSIGSAYTNMSTIGKDIDIYEHEFEYSDGLSLKDNLDWQIQYQNYFISTERPLVIPYQDTFYIAKTYTKYIDKFVFPIWLRVPVWGGVYLINEEGEIQHLTPKEARSNPVLSGQKLYPESLVTYYIDTQNFWRYKDGYISAIFNLWFDHDKQIEITDISSQGNKQPFLINTEDGLKWTVSVEPFGEAHGIYRIYLLDARTGDIEYISYTGKEIGPVKACDYTRKAHPEVDWDRFQVIEPIPVMPNRQLFWECRVVPEDGSGISYVAFVDPVSGSVVECEEDWQVYQFLKTTQYTNDTTEKIISGNITDIASYILDGTTYWVVEINYSDVYVTNANLLYEYRDVIVFWDMGDHVTFEADQNNIIRIL